MDDVVCNFLPSMSDDNDDSEKETLEVSDTDIEIMNKDPPVLVQTTR